MGILLALLGALAGVSGAVKWFRGSGASTGTSPLAVAEIVLGAVALAGAAAGLARFPPLAWTVVGAVGAAMVLSSVVHLRRVLRQAAQRAESEADRLKRFLGPHTDKAGPP